MRRDYCPGYRIRYSLTYQSSALITLELSHQKSNISHSFTQQNVTYECSNLSFKAGWLAGCCHYSIINAYRLFSMFAHPAIRQPKPSCEQLPTSCQPRITAMAGAFINHFFLLTQACLALPRWAAGLGSLDWECRDCRLACSILAMGWDSSSLFYGHGHGLCLFHLGAR